MFDSIFPIYFQILKIFYIKFVIGINPKLYLHAKIIFNVDPFDSLPCIINTLCTAVCSFVAGFPDSSGRGGCASLELPKEGISVV